MTIQTVMTLNASQVAYLRAAIACLLTVQGEAAARGAASFDGSAGFCADLRDEVLAIATKDGTVSPLDHQDGAELSDMLASCAVELRVTDAESSGITPFYANAPGSFTDLIGPDEEAWRVPVVLTVVGKESDLEAAQAAQEFMSRATLDEAVNVDEQVQAYDVGGYETAFFVPSPVSAISDGVSLQA